MQTIVELPEFLKRSENYLASHPASGDIMQGTGDIRKLRWSTQGKGKSGGVRVIYDHHHQSIPVISINSIR